LFAGAMRRRNPIVIPHVCNDIGAWGKGFVVGLGVTYPITKESYLAWHRGEILSHTHYPGGYKFKLGCTQFVVADARKPV
ncbi:hypothetical protein, partial [Streptococcus pneumoniae]|uniref:hypothetical protein n=1 Tax=Streptococcus pneumoniae TaxID=1313 RepID=UPI001E5F5F23